MYPIFAVVGFAAAVCGGYLIKYFSGNTDIAFSKAVRMDPNHQGGTDSRVTAHNSRFGMREINKRTFKIFPFNWTSKDGTRTLLALHNRSCLIACRGERGLLQRLPDFSRALLVAKLTQS